MGASQALSNLYRRIHFNKPDLVEVHLLILEGLQPERSPYGRRSYLVTREYADRVFEYIAGKEQGRCEVEVKKEGKCSVSLTGNSREVINSFLEEVDA